MKAIRTIVATAVIVFALTTVAMAGAQRLAGPADGETTAGAAAHAGTPPAAAQPAAATVTLSAKQFATLLRAARTTRAQGRDRDPSLAHDVAESRTHARRKARTHSGDDDAAGSTATASSHRTKSSTHHTSTHHTATRTSTGGGAHDGGTHDGGHNGGHD
jgi:hypothetical protein